MLISLIITGGVVALTAQLALGQLRYFHGIGALIAMRAQIGHATAIAVRALWSVSPATGDILVALDSAIEFHSAIGSGVVCDGYTGSVVIPTPRPESGNTLSAFWDTPQAGDRVHVFFDDSLGFGWLALHVAASPVPGPACPALGDVGESWLLALREPISIPDGAPLRFTRRARLSLYKASDDKWYLGSKEWNEDAQRFNSIQPVAGPLRAYSANPAETGFLLSYRDASGTLLLAPVETARIATIAVTCRAETPAPMRVRGLATAQGGSYEDSFSIIISLRNAQ
jgi:hypothetical protein